MTKLKRTKIAKFTIQSVIQNDKGEYIIVETGKEVPESLRKKFAFILPESSDPKVRRKQKKLKSKTN